MNAILTHNDIAPLFAPPPPPPPATVLLVEDDRSLRRYLEVALRRAGFAVLAAADGLEAMKLALTSPVDLVVTDSVMPHLGGAELCRFLKGHPTLNRLPVVLLSALDADSGASASAPRPDVFLAKPVGPEELAACVGRLLARAV